ncbi:TPA: hypothetical protein LC260_003194 [Salmonella enterica subsp. enterica serovar Eastbourne]|nr:hypothetical protein [Salmonella enterica subsp. enterica serovar Eastbourne]
MTGIIVLSSLPVYKRILLVRYLVPPGDDNQLTITADYYFHPQHEGPLCLFNCAACAQPHSPHHKIRFKKGGHQPNFKKKLMPPKTTHSNVTGSTRNRKRAVRLD